MELPLRLFRQMITVLVNLIEYQKGESLHHGLRVGLISSYFAEIIFPERLSQVFYAGILHDVALMNPEEQVCRNPELICSPECSFIANHPVKGAQIVSVIPGLEECAVSVGDHHEMWSGRGFPQGKSGDEIDLGGQILRYADAIDLFLRSHKFPTQFDLYDYVRQGKEKEFSPSLWNVFLDIKSARFGLLFKEFMDPVLFNRRAHDQLASIPEPPLPASGDYLEALLKVYALLVDTRSSVFGLTEGIVDYSYLIAKEMALPSREVGDIRVAAYLHDVGKVALPNHVLNKPGPLSSEEWNEMRRHPLITMEILDLVPVLREASRIAGHHHSRFDGTGYPDKLNGEEIPLGARIVSVADAIGAMLSDRPYRSALPTESVVQELKKEAGKQFDPLIVEVAVRLIKEGKIAPVRSPR